MGNVYLRLDDVTVGFGNNKIVSEITLELKKGEILTLIGPNGAGKSTILKTVTKNLKPLKGTIYLDGSDLTVISNKEKARKMSVVLTERIRPELMTCREVVALGRYPYTNFFGRLTIEDVEKIEESLAMVNALDIAELPFDKISDGQRQRILLAKAICQEPQIIILDEPTSFLDIKHKMELLFLLKELTKKKKTTILMSLHEIELAAKISDKLACVKENQILCMGNSKEIFTKECIMKVYDITDETYDLLYGDKRDMFI